MLLFGITAHLSGRRKRQLCLLALLTVAAAVSELISLGSVLPFLAVLTEPTKIWNYEIVQSFAFVMGWSSSGDLIMPLALLFITTSTLATTIRLFTLWIGGRLAAAIGSDLSCEAYLRTLSQPYYYHLRQNSSSLVQAITSQITRTVRAINAVLVTSTSLAVASSLFVGLFLVNWYIASISLILFGGAYCLIALASKRQLVRNSAAISASGRDVIKVLQEGLGAIRDVLLDGTQNTYLSIYKLSDRTMRQLSARNVFISQYPRYVLELIGLICIALLSALLVMQMGSGAAAIPLLGSFAFGAQRLLPALQQSYNGWSTLKMFNADLMNVLKILDQPSQSLLYSRVPLAINRSICFSNVSFRYTPETPVVLKGLNLTIPVGQSVGIIGSTGSGKSTMVDLLMGLLEPSQGQILIDDEILNKAGDSNMLASWRATIAHVPQNIFLADSSITENIAFGVPAKDIDHTRVRLAAHQAQIASFIESSPDLYRTFVGERGIRLSGGQRQRLGIARALYKDSSVLVLDEATSALDNETEQVVMQSIDDISANLTVIIIAHRLSTLAKCDRVIRLDNGKIVEDGPPAEVLPAI